MLWNQRHLVLVTSAASEIISTAEAKTHLRVDHTDDDTLIGGLIELARTAAEAYTRRAFLTTTFDYSLDEAMIKHPVIALPAAPLQSVTSVTSYADDNVGTVFSSDSYYTVTNGNPGRIALVTGNTWPTDLRKIDSMVIRFVAGWGDAITDVPDQEEERIKYAVLPTVAHLYENRGDEMKADRLEDILHPTSKLLLQPLKVERW